MTKEQAKRKLTAIFSADVKGYSRLMADDEEATVRTINAYRDLMTGLIKDHRGRVVDAKGDNVLAEFSSVVDAVRCAVQVQKELTDRNSKLPEHRRMAFRIGINLGDVIEEQGTIYGDGVNVAARLEGLAEGGGICISGTAFDQVKNRISVGYEYQGKQSVKNIPDPVRVYKVLLEPEAAGKVIGEEEPRPGKKRWAAIAAVAVLAVVAGGLIWNFYGRPDVEPASVEKMAFPLPDKPSIAVLPFANMSGDPKEDYFSDGLTEQIITTLARYPRLFVIARQSSFSYKGRPVKVQQVAEELGVQYVLEGSVQKSSGRVRITAQLIDAITGRHVWSERYDREVKDIFALQDEITANVMNGMSAELTEGEQARRWTQRGDINLKALEKHYQAQGYFCRHTKENYDKARPLFEEAIELEPKFVWPYVYLGYLHIGSVSRGLSDDPAKSFKMAFELGEKALTIDDSHDGAHSLMALNFIVKRQYDKALSEAERAIALNPNASDAYMILGNVLGILGRWEESLFNAKKSLRLSPFPGAAPFKTLGMAYFMRGEYDESIKAWKNALKVSPNFLEAHIYLAACYASMGRDAEARGAAKQVLDINPKFSIESFAKRSYFRNESDIERVVAALSKAGLPETPPLALPDKPSIAVLPFVNMSGDPEQEYFSDGITEEIITGLSKTPKLFVIARTSSFKYKGKQVDVRTVGRELGVRYVLEGSVRKEADKVRITAQLIDAKTGQHVCAERYDRDLKGIFAIQDEITMKILIALQVKLTEGEEARIYGKRTQNLEAYLLFLQGRDQLNRITPDGIFRGRQMVQEAIALDPSYASGYHMLALSYVNEVVLALTKDPKQSIARAVELEQKALALDDSLSHAHGLLGWLYTLQRQHDKGITECEEAVRLEPNAADVHFHLSLALKYAGRAEESIAMCKAAMRLNPIPVSYYYQNLTTLYCLTGQYKEATAAGKKAVGLEPNNMIARAFLAIAYSLSGKEEEASIEAKEVMRINPKFSVGKWEKTMPFKNKADKELIIAALRKAGLK
jgi:adenylate cyclase